ncbi:MAG: hypothetical protein EHM55_12235 [Acidobacteria bacterium]|nr:MAG: hypothetical protein EHM55_12235 [Acidobacteriota bacterium]
MAKPSRVSVQLIVRRGARDRFLKLKKKTVNLPVEVKWDRRKQERRRATSECTNDRRKADRRQKPPFTWELSDFVVVEKPRRRQKK